MINRFSQFLVEEERVVYFTFGRMNPPTIGHGKLLDVLARKAGRNPYKVFLSQTQDQAKNPLSHSDKVKHARKMFPKHARSIMPNKNVKNVMDIAVELHKQGFKKIVMVVGSDRIREFDVLLSKYNGKEARHGFYNFESINIISAGERDPDAEGVEGMSASKQRSNAKENDFVSFSQGLPKSMSNKDAKALFNAVRKGMGLKEQKEFKNHVQLEPVSELREAYVNNRLFEVGEEVVMANNGIIGNIKHLGSNYVIVESKGETWRCWLDGVAKVGNESNIEYEDAPYTDPGEDGVLREAFTKTQQHKLDPNLKLKHQVKHATKQYVDMDVDGDVDKADKMKQAKDFGDVAGVPNLTKYLKKRQDIEKKHTKKGVAFESVELDEATRVRWKRGKYPGEIEATIGGKKYKIEKALDHNDRHKGEWKVMVWDRGDWEWETTEYGKANAKAWIMNKHGIKESVEPHPEDVKAYKKTLDAEDQAADYNHRGNKARVTRAANHLSKKIAQHHPGLDSKGKIAIRTKLQNMKEANQPEWGTPESTAKAKKMTPGQNEGLWDNIRARRAAGKPKLKPGDKNYPKTLKIEDERKKDSPQDPDIKDRPGTQPKAYHAGLSKAQKIARDRQFKKQSKMSGDNPKAYKPAAGDKTTKTKPSKHTLKYKQMFGEDNVDVAKKRIEREKQMDKRKHDRMMDRARMRDVKKVNKETK